ncbi:hypothetical protein SAMN06295967_103217 [Belliella buryatensis]|uniref:Uncharacterized protein n=1 Tax=Belliella buryatensis TaxID=1500549 RepID=A0A239BSK9_9BACT|nr:hypothetical protein [Belliella buryatensis]SNS11007.1 hypothetical protein SAMN06295967_103217 [Belliella buryatensis]
MKKHTHFIFVLGLLFSCSQKATDDFGEVFSYNLDTLVIDSKDRNLDLSRNITNASVNMEKNTIYQFNKFDHSIDEINL